MYAMVIVEMKLLCFTLLKLSGFKFSCRCGNKILLICNCSYHIYKYYDRIDVPEGLNINKSNGWRRNIIWLLLVKVNFRFRPKVCDSCHDLMQKKMIIQFISGILVKMKLCI